jgi:hypothetical protein
MKVCQKDNCNELSIRRGKYCEMHRTKKIPNREVTLSPIRTQESKTYEDDIEIALELSRKIYEDEKKKQKEEDRFLKEQQEKEYYETLKIDEKILKQKEKDIEDEIDKERNKKIEFEIKKNRVILNMPSEEDENIYNIKIKLSNTTLIRKFKKNCTIEDIRDFLYVYNDKTNEYNLVLNSPFKKFTKEDVGIKIESLNLPKNFILFVENLDT